MIQIKTNIVNKRRIINIITDFYIDIWKERNNSNTLKKYSVGEAWKNIHNALTFFNKSFDDTQLRNTIIARWKTNGWYEIQYSNWHFAVIVQLDLFGNNIAIVQDCINDKDYHNNIMQTQPFQQDNTDDKSHLVDWIVPLNIDSIIKENINRFLKNNLLKT